MPRADRALASLPDVNDANAVVAAFASNPAFRAAEWSELTTPNNPYRRPVRPDDLKWVKYHNEMPAEKALRLSALLGHRMLRNIYDLDVSIVAPVNDEAVATEREHFYTTQNRIHAAMARPKLERHLFSFLEDDDRAVIANVDDLVSLVEAESVKLGGSESASARALRQLTGKREGAVFVIMQYHGFMSAVRAAIGKAAVGEFPAHADKLQALLLDSYLQWVSLRPAYRSLLDIAGLTQTPGAHWQLLLGTSLARGNHLLSLAADGSRLAELTGAAWFFHTAGARDTAQLRESIAEALGDDPELRGLDLGVGWPDTLTGADIRDVVEALVQSFGPDAVDDFHRGFANAATLHGLWDDDLATQITWADQIELHKDYAEKIHRYLEDNEVVVDLDTFVESEEETSTTHVHNEHRLVMIEEGQMHFWNNVTHKIELFTGDKILIPISRLHGSTVLSGVCTYHQPIISDDLLNKIL